MADTQRAVIRDFAHHALDERGLSLAVSAHEGHFLTAPYGKRSIREHRVLSVTFRNAIADYGEVTAPRTRRPTQVERTVIDLVHLNGHDFGQLLDAALHLNSFRWLIAEAFNEVLDIGYLLLLVAVGAQLLFASLGTQADVLVVGHAVVRQFAARYFYGTVGHIVEEGAIMAHHHHGGAATCEVFFQPTYALDVEMVGRLVQK